MKFIKQLWCACCLLAALTAAPVSAQTGPRALILYDAPPGTAYTKLGLGYAIMLRNLLGHFDSQVDMVPVHDYVAGQVNNYDATFYLGAYYDNQVPPAFLADVTTTTKTPCPSSRSTSRRRAKVLPIPTGPRTTASPTVKTTVSSTSLRIA